MRTRPAKRSTGGGLPIRGAQTPQSGPVGSAASVDVPAVLNSMHQDGPRLVVDLVHDSVVAATCRPQPDEFAHQCLANPSRLLGKGTEHQRDGGVASLARQPIEMSQTFSRGLDLEQPSACEVIAESHTLTTSCLTTRSRDRRRELRIAQDVKGLFERLQVVRTDQHERGSAVAGDEDSVMVLLDSVGELRQVALGIGERHSLTHRSEF